MNPTTKPTDDWEKEARKFWRFMETPDELIRLIQKNRTQAYTEGMKEGRKEGMLDTDEEWRMAIGETGGMTVTTDGERMYEIVVKDWGLLHELISPEINRSKP